MASVEDFLKEWRSGATTVEAHTSGSTGDPKIIRLLKSDMIASAEATNAFFGIDHDSTLVLPLSVDYIAGKMMAVRSEVAGCRLVEMPVSNHVVVEEPADLMSVVPTQLDSLFQQANAPSLIRNLLIGGAPLSAGYEKLLVEKGYNAWLGYGMTETCSHVAIRRVGEADVFRAMPGISFSCDDRGCLVIHSARFSWKTITTNDVVDLQSPESFRWLGRYDNVVNSGGVKLHPELLEKSIRSLFRELPPFYLAGEPDPRLGQRLVMVMENPPEGILEKIRARLSDGKTAPKRLVAVEALPRTANGKVKRIVP